MKKYLLFLLISFATACSSEPGRPNERPGGEGGSESEENPSIPVVDISDHLADSSPRVVLTDTVVKYDDGGVIFGRNSSGSLFAINVTNGWRIDFDYRIPSLKVAGKAIEITDAHIAKRTDTMTWYVATPIEEPNRRMIFVTQY